MNTKWLIYAISSFTFLGCTSGQAGTTLGPSPTIMMNALTPSTMNSPTPSSMRTLTPTSHNPNELTSTTASIMPNNATIASTSLSTIALTPRTTTSTATTTGESPSNKPKFCSSDNDQGWGYKKKVRYYYDTKTNECKPFKYRGFGGNSNRFVFYRMCIRICALK